MNGANAAKKPVMNVTIETPSWSFDTVRATKVRVRTVSGWWGFLPRHRDTVTLVSPGIATIDRETGGPLFVAIDGGVLTKVKENLTLVVSRAATGPTTADLERIVGGEYAASDEREAHTRRIIARLEADFLRSFPMGKGLT
jgi:F-type H+-transporting ATPase subunit epsilon